MLPQLRIWVQNIYPNLFLEYQVFDFLERTFEMLHTQDTDYIIDTITTYIDKKR